MPDFSYRMRAHINQLSFLYFRKVDIGTGIENVRIFIKADNAENELERHLSTSSQIKRKSEKVS